MPDPAIGLRLLGRFAVQRGGGVTPKVLKPRVQALLGWLIVHRGVSHPRSHIAGVLWPESSEAQAKTNLRNLLFRLRKALPEVEPCVRVDGGEISWRDDERVDVDVVRFEQAATIATDLEEAATDYAQRLADAVEAYGGELLPGFTDDWVRTPRKRLGQLYLEIADELAGHYERTGATRDAIRLTEALLRHDPLSEPTHRRHIRLRDQSGDRAGALRAYHACVEALQRELGAAPGVATLALYERLSQDKLGAPAVAVSWDASLVGRTTERERLRQCWQTACDGALRVVCIHGDAGVGKTRLAEDVVAGARALGASVAVGRCYPGVGTAAYGPVAQWLRAPSVAAARSVLDDERLIELARVVPEVRDTRPDLPPPARLEESWQHQRFVDALVAGLFAAGRPLLVLLDDVQWADAETLSVLHALVQRGAREQVLALVTERRTDTPAGHPWPKMLRSLQRDALIDELSLGPFDQATTAALADALVGRSLAPELAARLYRESEGNALFVVELMRAGIDKLQTSETLALPATVQAVIDSRIDAVSTPARELLRVIAVARGDTPWPVLLVASQLDEAEATDSIDELWRRGLVRERSGDAYAVSHGKIADAVYAQLSGARRRFLHRRVAEALVAVGVDDRATSGRAAHHFAAAGANAEAARWYRRVAEHDVTMFANADARRHLETGLALLNDATTTANDDGLALREALGDLLVLTGDTEAAGEVFRATTALLAESDAGDALRQARLQRKLADALLTRQQHDGAWAASEVALKTLRAVTGASTVAQAREWIEIQTVRLMTHYWRADVEAMGDLAEELHPQLNRYGSAQQRARFHQSMIGLAHRRHRYAYREETKQHAHAYVEAAKASGAMREMGEAWFMLGFARLGGGQLDDVHDPLHNALQIADKRGDAWLALRCVTYLSQLARRTGQPVEVDQHTQRIDALARQLELASYQAVAVANRAWLALRDGRRHDCLHLARQARTLWSQSKLVYPFQWVALFPLIAALDKPTDELQATAAMLIDPTQLWLPTELSKSLGLLADHPTPKLITTVLAAARTLGML